MNPYTPFHEKQEDLPQIAGCSMCDVVCRFDFLGGNGAVFKKKCCKKYKRKGRHCKSCPKL